MILDNGLFWGFILIEALILLRGMLILSSYQPQIENEENLSVIIPLKGWDETLPDLIVCLLNQKYHKKIEVIVVADKENACLQGLPKTKNLKIHYSLALEEGWQDKNWRLYQGCQVACYETLLFLDSDVTIDYEYLKTRLGTHKGELSFSIPLYVNSKNAPARFLASCTNFLNFSIYKFGFCFSHLGTAIGPSMLFTCGRNFVSQALQATKKEIADDHALGFWFKENGYGVTCSQEPVYVKADKNATWSGICSQLIRWFFLTRTVTHLLHWKSALVMIVCLALSAMGCLGLLLGIITFLFYSTSMGLGLIFAGLIFMMSEAILLVLIERFYTMRNHHNYAWHHLAYIPVVLIGCWVLFMVAMMKQSIKWRGKVYQS